MDRGRESRWEKDAMTVEIGFALVSAIVLAALVFGVVVFPVLVWELPARVSAALRMTGGVLSLAAGLWRVVHVLWRFDRNRRAGR